MRPTTNFVKRCPLSFLPTGFYYSYNDKILNRFVKVETLYKVFLCCRKWLEEITLANKQGRKPSLLRAMTKAFWMSYAPSGIMFLIQALLLKWVQLHWRAHAKRSFWTQTSCDMSNFARNHVTVFFREPEKHPFKRLI